MSKILSIKKTSSIFLAIVLVAGTIALSFPSFMTVSTVQAQLYDDDRMDNSYNSYGPTADYGMDNNDRNSYGNNNYYQSEYQSYGVKENYKSKDSSKSVSINKLKCINNNININGNNTGDINLGNKGASEGYSGAYSSGGEGYYDGHNNKKGKGFDCIINNNNNNTNIVTGAGGGNVTIPEPQSHCEECFTLNLNEQQINALEDRITQTGGGVLFTIEDFCEGFLMSSLVENSFKLEVLELRLDESGIPDNIQQIIIGCLEDLEII